MFDKENRIMSTELYIKDGYLYAKQLFDDLKEVVDYDKEQGCKTDRKHPAQKLLNRFSAQYFSPSNVKAFRDCPASQIIQTLMPFEPNDATEIGKTVHSVFEKFYNLEGSDRELPLLDKFLDEELEGKEQTHLKGKIQPYIDGFKNTPDYLDRNKEMDHKNLTCFNELFIKGKFSPLNVELPYKMYSLADRVDFRGQYAYIIDYKTGQYLNKKILTMEGYLPQIIAYKWAVEETYGVEVAGGYLLVPGTKQLIADLDINSLENQSRYIDIIFQYKEDSQKMAETRIYPVNNMNKYLKQKLKKYATIENTEEYQTLKIDYDVSLPEE